MKPIFESYEASFLFYDKVFERLHEMSDDEIYQHAALSKTSSLFSFLEEVQRWDEDGVNQCFHVLCDRLCVDYDAYPDYDSLYDALDKAIRRFDYQAVNNSVPSDCNVVYYDTDSHKGD